MNDFARSIRSIVVFLSICLISFQAHANREYLNSKIEQAISNGEKLIEGSYIIGFKPPSAFLKKDADPLILPSDESKRGSGAVPFGEHGTGQSKEELASKLGLRGEIISIFQSINAIHVLIDEAEAERWKKDERVEYVEQDQITTGGSTQINPGWGLDRLDEASPLLDNTYVYTNTGAGRIIYIIDTGINLANSAVANEFGGRASVIWDVNGGTGMDCNGHGTFVASIAGGNTRGVAKGAQLIGARITNGCTGGAAVSTSVTAFNWLASYAPRGSIANWSHELSTGNCSIGAVDSGLENSVKAAHNAGIILVVAAGNDGCNTASYSPARIPEAFVVGATTKDLFSTSKDAKWVSSRTGTNISAFAPGKGVAGMWYTGVAVTGDGTSFAAPYIAGIFAIACQAAGTLCNTAPTVASLYTALRNTGTIGTVTNTNGTPLTGATSRFIRQQW